MKYAQSDATTVALRSDNPYRGEVRIKEDSSTSVFSGGVLTLPSGATSTTISLAYSADDEAWYTQDKTSSLTTLNADIPVGSYTLTMTKVAGGTTVVPFTITSLDFPDAPVISNYTNLQSIDAASALTISWTEWSDGTGRDFIIVRIDDASTGNTIYELDPGETGALTGTDTSVTIPANTLATGTSYILSVQFAKGYTYYASGAISDYPSAMKAVYNSADTQMTIQTKNIFSDLTHTYAGWVDPKVNVVSSLGWLCDANYPWVYSVSEDTLANAGTYAADSKGWLYIYPQGALLDGFYFYRTASGHWAYTSYNWSGWIYDYTTGWVDLTPVQ